MSIFNNNELAEAKQQNAQLLNQLNASKNAVEATAQACRDHLAKAAKAERARDEAEYALQQAQKEIATLKTAVTQMNGEGSLFVQVGKTRHLISSITAIGADHNGNTESINGRPCGTNTMPAQTVENLVVGYQKNRRASR